MGHFLIADDSFAAGSTSVSNSRINSNFKSVTEQTGIKAGDGGFAVDVRGNTELKGGVIASTDAAVAAGRNNFTTSSLTMSDIENLAEYEGRGGSVSGGYSTGETRDRQGNVIVNTDGTSRMVNTPSAGAGVGEDSGSAASVTKSGISGIAGNTDVRSNDAETGIKPIFDADKVRKEIDAQIQITQEFGQRASRAVGEYASSKMREANSLRDQAGKEPNPDKRAALLADAQALEDQWGANGTLRLAAHTVIGGLTGGSHGGVAGAATALMSIVVSPRSSRTLLGRLPSTTLDELSNAPGIDHAPNSNNRFTRNKHQRSLRADPATAKKT